ncbi:hypothetical protein BKA61DRAFT_143595 [Leptodontidium sp. MPI-SDFR-AT-0119]|nr:hypothetical protein BKA61DRAFT_143595 [Leptodontidium sp. MPI-SDFR-AT-0119]
MQSAGGMQYVCLVAQSTTKVQSSFDFDFEQRGDQISIFWQACLLFISPSLVVIVVAALGSSWGSWIFLALRAFLSFFFCFVWGMGQQIGGIKGIGKLALLCSPGIFRAVVRERKGNAKRIEGRARLCWLACRRGCCCHSTCFFALCVFV